MKKRFWSSMCTACLLAGVLAAGTAGGGLAAAPTRRSTLAAQACDPPRGYALYTMDADGTAVEPLTAWTGDAYNAAWSPDGSKVAFTGVENCVPKLHIVTMDDPEPTTILPDDAAAAGPTWSPDGSQIAYIADDGLWVVDADGGNRRWIIVDGVVGISVSWSPEGDRFAFSANAGGNDEVLTMNVDGTDLRNVSNHPASDVLPNWSPDGTRLVFSSDRDAESDR